MDTLTKRWHLLAKCAAHPNPEWWTSSNQTHRAAAIDVCRTCPVRRECGEEGRGMVYGIWGGVVRG